MTTSRAALRNRRLDTALEMPEISSWTDPSTRRRWTIVREDLRPGGTKGRFLGELIEPGVETIVYGGPRWGGAAAAVAYVARQRRLKCVLFYAASNQLTTRQLAAEEYGAEIRMVTMGRLSNVLHKTRAFARGTHRGYGKIQMLEWGLPQTLPRVTALAEKLAHLDFTEAWVAAGSGIILRAMLKAFYPRPVFGVQIMRQLDEHERSVDVTKGVEAPHRAYAHLYTHPSSFDVATKFLTPFPTSPNYDGKAWEIALPWGRGRPLFWNVMGPRI
jgi:hypothetical protein